MASPLLQRVLPLLAPIAAREAGDPERYPRQSIADLSAAGVLAAPLPPSRGGSGATLLDMVDATELVAAASPSVALLMSMPIGLAGALAAGAPLAPPEHRDAAA